MTTGTGFIAARGGANHSRVERTALLAEIDAELARSGIVMLCGPWGYGRSTLLRDYARIAHSRMPARPVVRVDFDTFEAQAFLNGNFSPAVRALNRARKGRRASSAAALAEDEAEADARAPSSKPLREDGSDVLRRIPARYANGMTHLLYEYMVAHASRWCMRFEHGAAVQDMEFGELPLVTIDNLPYANEEELAELAEAFSAWSHAGARLLVACAPLTFIPRSLLPDAFIMTAHTLEVSADELALWSRELRMPADIDVAGATNGVPLLVDACRSVCSSDPRRDDAFMRASDRVVRHCLDELMCTTTERARWAMVMLGSGTLADLSRVGALPREDELAILVETYPLFGIDVLKGTFSCIPVICGGDADALARAANGDEALTQRCAELLVHAGRLEQAGELAGMLSDTGKLRLLARLPDAFADTGNGGLIERVVRATVRGSGIDGSLHLGLARLARLHAVAHDIPVGALPDYVARLTSGTSEGALRAVACVFDFWKSPVVCAPGSDQDAEDGEEGTTYRPPHEKVGDVEGLVRALGVAGLHGDAERYRERLKALADLPVLAQGGLATSVYALHAVVCGLMCDEAETALAFVEPFAAAADGSSLPGEPSCISAALLSAAHAMAQVFVEKPSAARPCTASLGRVHTARLFCEERSIEPAAAVLRLGEAICLLTSGAERRAEDLLVRCQARWSVQGTLLGQLAVNLGLAACDFAQGGVNQAAVRARVAETLAQQLGLRRAVWLARLFETIATVRNGNAPDLDRRLLEATLRQTSLHPSVSIALNIELAFLYAARADRSEARDILQSVGLFGRPAACRLLVGAVRALGRSRTQVLDLLPRQLRLEYESMRPSSVLRASGAVVPAMPEPFGSLATEGSDKALSISLLGGFKVLVNGIAVGEREWGRRKSRDILVALALRPGIPVSRDELVDMLWEGRTQTAELRNNFSTALSGLRASLGQKGGGPSYLLAAGGSVALNLEIVDVDVLRFEQSARMLLSRRQGTSPDELLEVCGSIDQLFKTGFAPELRAMAPRIARRLRELDGLFVDCMVMGSKVALEEGDLQLAVWFARSAARVSAARDDVRAALVEAVDALERREQGEADPVAVGGAKEQGRGRPRRAKRAAAKDQVPAGVGA